MPFRVNRPPLALVLALLIFSVPLRAQGELSSAWTASRTDLERRANELDALAMSTAYSERARTRSAQEAANIRRRLVEGDFRVGDRIFVAIEGAGQDAQAVTAAPQDTLTVLDGSRIYVRNVGEISLAGVLRSELQRRVNSAVNEVILNSRATTRPLVRLAVFGAVVRPGYYNVPLETRIDDLIMLAGGPTVAASTEKMQMVRGDTIILAPSEVRSLIATGAVIGAMGLREGDQLVVEQGPQPIDRQTTLQFVFLFASPIITTVLFRILQ